MTSQQIQQTIEQGVQHHKAGRLHEAQRAYREVLAAHPDHALALHWLGMLAGQSGQTQTSIALLRKVIQLQPSDPTARNNLGNALRDAGELDEALTHYAKVAELGGDAPVAYANMASVYFERGLVDQGLECTRQALALKPTAAIHSNYLYALHFSPKYDAKMLLAEHKLWSERFERPLVGKNVPFENDADPERRLKVGFVSADFYNHPVGRFLLPLLAGRDRGKIEIHFYSDMMKPVDHTTRQLQAGVDRWQNIKGIPDAALADLIRRDRIDILVDLAQHSADNRMVTFAHKPAPVQVAWLGYPGTTGLSAMDYRLTDPYLDPPGQGDENYSERSIRLPHCFWCYESLDATIPVSELPAVHNGCVTFGSLNRFGKVTPAVLAVWRRILQAVPSSRLLIHSHIGQHLENIRRPFVEAGIAPRRLEFLERTPMPHYYRQYHRLDIALDSFPYGGGTITCDAMWMGVPVVTLAGQTAVGRGGASLLSNVGLPELIARSEEEYISIALDLAADISRLAELRRTLRLRMQSSPLMDARQFAGDMEAAYRQMWKSWCLAQAALKESECP